jgi:hypothetical protein
MAPRLSVLIKSGTPGLKRNLVAAGAVNAQPWAIGPIRGFSGSAELRLSRGRHLVEPVTARPGRAPPPQRLSWKMIPSAVRPPLVTVLTPWRIPTRW